ncbi:hypothetical protein C2S53_000093 [Perilla frutescens var. hirtella]|uniref:Uncharacterized protein n=1 Tax=Perilla frutescens var. hirtella TaxID=608512 RepID=A0AAD4IYN0_PERFH|nr:hypothetical protein C2S53_000093 [Perilla frutescens var. hirtella]
MEEYGDFAKQLEDEIMNCTSEKKVGKGFVERTEKIHRNSNKEVDIMECSEHSDTTECSSSFDDSDCGDEGVDDTLGNSEVLSGFHGGNESALNFDGSGKLFPVRKKLSAQWRSFIHPLMWRCKWVELKIKKLEAQAQKYDTKLQGYSQKNPVQSEKSTLEGHGLNSPTLPQRSEVLRRKKRRRAEATYDVESYMSHHNLFSYYERRSYIRDISHNVLKNPADAPKEVNNGVELGNEEVFCVEAGSCDKFVEDALRKIELLHSRVLKLKSRAGEVVSEHAGKLSSADALNPPISLSLPPSMMYQMPVETYLVSQLMSEYNFGGLLLPESAVPSNGEVVTDANGSKNLDHLASAYEEDEYDEEILIDNLRVHNELRYLEEVKIHSFQRPWVLKDALGSTSIPQPPKTTDDQPRRLSSNLANALKSISKSGRRKG